jgi:hypothetical protein
VGLLCRKSSLLGVYCAAGANVPRPQRLIVPRGFVVPLELVVGVAARLLPMLCKKQGRGCRKGRSRAPGSKSPDLLRSSDSGHLSLNVSFLNFSLTFYFFFSDSTAAYANLTHFLFVGRHDEGHCIKRQAAPERGFLGARISCSAAAAFWISPSVVHLPTRHHPCFLWAVPPSRSLA